jgi:hypothetical protein
MLSCISKTSVCRRLAGISWLALSVCTLSATAAQKPVRQVEIHGEGIQPPESLEELWDKSAVVVDGRVVDVRPSNQTVTPTASLPAGAAVRPVTLVATDYVIQVHRVLKADDVVTTKATTVIVRRHGGTLDSGDYIAEMVDRHFAKFKPSGRYVLFLKRANATVASTPVYFPVVGPDSAFELHGNQVLPLGRAGASRQLAKYGADQLVAALASKGGR